MCSFRNYPPEYLRAISHHGYRTVGILAPITVDLPQETPGPADIGQCNQKALRATGSEGAERDAALVGWEDEWVLPVYGLDGVLQYFDVKTRCVGAGRRMPTGDFEEISGFISRGGELWWRSGKVFGGFLYFSGETNSIGTGGVSALDLVSVRSEILAIPAVLSLVSTM